MEIKIVAVSCDWDWPFDYMEDDVLELDTHILMDTPEIKNHYFGATIIVN